MAPQDCLARQNQGQAQPMTTSGASMPLALTLLIAVATIDIPAAVPPTPTGSVVDFVHGRPIADPYRWLEQLDDPAVESWARADRKSTRLNSSHYCAYRMPSSA